MFTIFNAIAEKLKHNRKGDFQRMAFEADHASGRWYLRYPPSYRDLEEMFNGGAGLVERSKGHSPSLAQGGVR